MMKKFFFAWPIAALFLTGGLTRLHGATNYWDNNGDVAGFGTAGGIWGVEAKWSVDPAGASEPTGTNTTTDDDLFFGVDSVGLGAGTITVQGAQGFRSISFGETSGTMLLTNGTLTLARPFSALCLHNPTNEIASALTGSGGLHKITAETSCTYNQYLPTSAVVIVSNQSLAKLKDVTAVLGGKSISGGSATAVPYNLTHDGATITFQLQVINGGEFIKCVRVELTQTGPDISARAVYAKYIKTSAASLGFDFDGGGTKYTVATDPSMDGYGVSQITFLFGPRTSLRLSGVNTYTGDTQLEEGGLEIVGAGQLGGGSYTGTIQLAAGDLLYRSLADQRFEGPITGAGKLIRESAGLRTEACVYTQFLPTVAQVIYTNKLLSTCVAVTGLLGGKSILFGQQPISASVYHYMQTPTKITYQLQALDGPHLKCVKVELTQMANGVAARAVAAWYFTGGALGFNFDAGREGAQASISRLRTTAITMGLRRRLRPFRTNLC